jgi:hypothetical protein
VRIDQTTPPTNLTRERSCELSGNGGYGITARDKKAIQLNGLRTLREAKELSHVGATLPARRYHGPLVAAAKPSRALRSAGDVT